MAGKLWKSRCLKCQYYTTSLAFLLLPPYANALCATVKTSSCSTSQTGSGLDENYLKSKAGILRLWNTQAPSGPLKCFTEREAGEMEVPSGALWGQFNIMVK